VNSNRFVKIVVRAFAFVAIVYVLAVLRGFDETVVIHDTVGLPQDQVNELLEHARDLGSFDPEPIDKLRRESRWTPWSRAKLLMAIEGTQDEVTVTAGFSGGPTYGGGHCFSVRRVSGKWEFFEEKFWVSWTSTQRHRCGVGWTSDRA
jgi:hypothetical protein